MPQRLCQCPPRHFRSQRAAAVDLPVEVLSTRPSAFDRFPPWCQPDKIKDYQVCHRSEPILPTNNVCYYNNAVSINAINIAIISYPPYGAGQETEVLVPELTLKQKQISTKNKMVPDKKTVTIVLPDTKRRLESVSIWKLPSDSSNSSFSVFISQKSVNWHA